MNILLSETARDIFFGQLVGKTLNHIRGDAGLCYEPPQHSRGRMRGCNTYSSLSRGNKPALSGDTIKVDSIYISPLFNARPSDRSFNPSTIIYSQLTNAQEVIDNC